MKFLFSFFLYIVPVCIVYSQDCNTQAANKPTTYAPNFQNFMNPVGKPASWDITKIKPQLAKVESWMRTMLKGFTGAKLMYGNDYFLDPTGTNPFYKTSGLKGNYKSIMMFFAYYCYDNKYPIETEGESGSSMTVDFNNVFAGDLCKDFTGLTINGKLAFLVLEKSKTAGRIDYYDLRKRMNFNDTVYTSKKDIFLIRNSDKPVFIPVTRKEYLQQLLKNAEDYKITEIASAKLDYTPANEAANKAKFDEELKRIDNSKNYTPEQMAPYRKRFIETWETEKQKFDKRIARVETETTQSKEVLLEYLKKPQEWLGRSLGSFYSYSYTANGLKSYFDHLDIYTESKEDYTRSEVVSINPDYFNKALSMDVPQLIMLTLTKNGYRYMYKLADLIKQPGALSPLEALMNPGKSTPIETAPSTITSNYKLSFLPKLNKLEPLTIPADMKASAMPVIPFNNPPAAKLNVETPVRSPKLNQLPAQPFTLEAYKNYVQDLHAKIAVAIKPEEKKKADDYVKNKKITQSKDISNTALAAWLQNTPKASLYLNSMAVVTNLSDGLAANNFSAFLIMSGLPEKSIPILEYWNKQQPGKATILANLGNAYYRLGDIITAMNYLQQCVQKDSLNPTANKILCMMYLKKGDVKKAEEHGTRSITTTHDQQVISILFQLNNKIKPGEIMSRLPPLPAKEFPMLKRIKLPALPSRLYDMEQFVIDFNAEKESLSKTIDDIEAKIPKDSGDLLQKQMMKSFAHGISPIRVKAQYIIIDGMQIYQRESIREADVFKYNLKKLAVPYSLKVNAIVKKYNAQIAKLPDGEGGQNEEIDALELAKCKEVNAETENYLSVLSPLVNGYAQRREFISRKFYRDYANWAPYWIPGAIPFPSIEKDYLKDVSNILSEYRIVTKSNCSVYEPLPKKEGVLKEWEDEYCANFKGKLGIGPGKIFATCNSWGIEGGEGIVGGFEVNYADDGAFEDVSFELGFGANWNLGTEHIAQIGAGASVKEFVKIGPDNITREWVVTDAGGKGEIAIEGEIGNVSGEVKVIEVTAGYTSGVNKEGILVPILNLK
jgi:tetratricopeptide (TPR) repeat protein